MEVIAAETYPLCARGQRKLTWYTAEVGDTTLKDVLTPPLACSRALLYSSFCKLYITDLFIPPVISSAECELQIRSHMSCASHVGSMGGLPPSQYAFAVSVPVCVVCLCCDGLAVFLCLRGYAGGIPALALLLDDKCEGHHLGLLLGVCRAAECGLTPWEGCFKPP